MALPEIETARLYLRQFARDDLETFAEIRSDPDVMRYIRTGKPNTREQVVTYLGTNESLWLQHGFGRWAVISKEDDKLVGWSGLAFLDGTDEIEYGGGMSKNYWGKGLITEASLASLKYGFEELKLSRIASVTMPENVAARHVLENIGMRYVNTAYYYGNNLAYYEIHRADFLPTAFHYNLRRT